jgi:hypothetical protein
MPEDLARAVVYFASEGASYVTVDCARSAIERTR